MNYHILGIAGTMTTPIALDLIHQGHTITGSDQEKIYPPISTVLARNNIKINQVSVDKHIDQVIVGSSFKSFSRCQKEFDQIKEINIPYISATEYLAQNLIRPNSILVAGSYGKSTISALLTWVLLKNKFNPSYFFGAQTVNKIDSLKINKSDWSIVEADESINGLDTQAKFLYYPVKYLILTSANWEHKESYSTADDNLNAFKKLVANIPNDGLLVYNQNSKSATELAKFCHCSTISYAADQNFDSSLIGQHNQENISAVFTLCSALGIEDTKIISAIKSFKGIKRRLEIISSNSDITVIDDFAQSPIRVKSAIDAVKSQYPQSNIFVFFEPHASFLQKTESLVGFKQSFSPTEHVFLGQIKFNKNLPKENRVTFKNYQSEIGSKISYLPTESDLYQQITSQLKPNDVLIHFSSGGLSGIRLIQKIASFFRHK